MPFFNDPQSPLGNPFPKNLAGWAPMPINIGAVAPAPAAGGAAGAGGAGSGSLPGTYNPASGGIPRVPTSGESLQNLIDAISNNLGNLGPIISGITGASNQALRDQYPSSYFDTLNTLMGTNAQRAKGDITDLLPQLGQIGAEWGIGGGVAGSPAATSKLARDVIGSSYAVQQQALQNQGAIQNLIPKVAPYDASRLIPTYGDTSSEGLLRAIYGSAPIPEAAYGRARADALAGLNRGFNAGGGGYNWFNPMARPTVGAVGPGAAMGPGFRAGVANPVGPGWGVTTNDEGGFGSIGNVPAWALPPGVAGLPEGGLPPLGPVQDNTPFFNRNLWDNPLDMPQDLGAGFDENGFMV